MSNDPNKEDNRRDHLIGDVLDALADRYTALSNMDFRFNCGIHLAVVYSDTGHNQTDYDYLLKEAEKWLNANQ